MLKERTVRSPQQGTTSDSALQARVNQGRQKTVGSQLWASDVKTLPGAGKYACFSESE